MTTTDLTWSAHGAPGPIPLGRGAIVTSGGDVPAAWHQAWQAAGVTPARVHLEASALHHASAQLSTLHECWLHRRPVIVDLDVDIEELKQPETRTDEPYLVGVDHQFVRERLQFLLWANNYDLRTGGAVWWHAVLAVRHAGAQPTAAASGDILLPNGEPAWVDGGPRGPVVGLAGHLLVHRESIGLRRLTAVASDRGTSAHETPSATPLAADQHAAVEHSAGPARIIAPAGSGKTRVLVARLRHLIGDRHIEPELITAVAYNSRAAAEMRQRLDGLDVRIRTLHALALWICNLEERRAVADERSVRDLLRSLVKVPRIPNQDPYQAYIEALAEIRIGLTDPELVEARRDDVDGLSEMFPRYREALARKGLLDFDEQIYRAIELLLADAALRSRVQRSCTHLLVDEFQDLTPAFLLLIRLIAGPSMQVFAVGDDDQTIYGYSGATPHYLTDIDRWFPGAQAHALTVNYRCARILVTAADNLLSHNLVRVAKTIHPRPHAPEGNLQIHRVEPAAMADRVLELVEANNATRSPTAVLSRVNSALLGVQVALTEAGIRHSAPLDPSVLQRTGLRTAFAYLRMAVEPDMLQRNDIIETINRPARKVKSAVVPLLKRRQITRAQLRRVGDALDESHRDRFLGYLRDLNRLARAVVEGATTADCLALIRHRIGLGAAMDALDASRTRPEGSSHADDLDALEQVAARHPDPSTFEAWLTSMLRVPADADGITLSTVHRVKGMEWPHVVIFGANAGLFPHRLADDEEEERRVFHVALTRGADRVDVIADSQRPTLFLDELHRRADPDELARRQTEQRGLAQATRPSARRDLSESRRQPRGRPSATETLLDAEVVVDATDALYGALVKWRLETARRAKIPPYFVFHDRQLQIIAGRRPQDLGQLATCPGVGPTKLERYGDDLLDLIERYG